MTEQKYSICTHRSTLPASAAAVFAWHKREGAIHRLTPPWQDVTVLRKDPSIDNESRTYLQIKKGPLRFNWIAEHCDYIEGKQFSDVQVKGPFAYWKHQHLIHSGDSSHSDLEETISYRLPGGVVGNAVLGSYSHRQIEQMLAYRQRTLVQDLLCVQRYADQKPQRILVSGATGLVGASLIPFLLNAGHQVVRLVRKKATLPTDILWDPAKGMIEEEKLERFDAVIHLAGESIASGRWTRAKKALLRSSRVDSTKLLVNALAKQTYPPKIFLCASAIGFYGNRGDALLDEDSPKGTGFLADLCQEWEEAANGFKTGRVVSARLGMVLSPRGGALRQMLLPFQLGGGGVLGSGAQYYSWVGIDDVVYHLYNALMDDRLRGSVNIVSPNPVTNAAFTKTLGEVLCRPTFMPMPAAVVGLIFGEMGEALLLSSSRVVPKRLSQIGCDFAYPGLESCLRHLLGKQ